MKVKVYTETPDSIERAGYWELKEVEVSTADLIAELEKRRPSRGKCTGCISNGVGKDGCEYCIWDGTRKDNFKEAK